MNEAMQGSLAAKGQTLNQLGIRGRIRLSTFGRPLWTLFSIGEADVSLRPGGFFFFYHEDQDLSLSEVVRNLLSSVEWVPLLLIPPNQDGLFDEKDIRHCGATVTHSIGRFSSGAKVSGHSITRLCLSSSPADGQTSSWASIQVANPIRARFRIT